MTLQHEPSPGNDTAARTTNSYDTLFGTLGNTVQSPTVHSVYLTRCLWAHCWMSYDASYAPADCMRPPVALTCVASLTFKAESWFGCSTGSVATARPCSQNQSRAYKDHSKHWKHEHIVQWYLRYRCCIGIADFVIICLEKRLFCASHVKPSGAQGMITVDQGDNFC